MLVAIPDDSDPAAMIGVADVALDAWRAVGPQLAAKPGASVLVQGGNAQAIALYAAAIAVTAGAGVVDYVDDDPVRLATAARFGANAIPRPWEPERRYDIVVEGDGREPARLVEAIRATVPQGDLTTLAIHFKPVELPMTELYSSGINLTFSKGNIRTLIEPVLHLCSHCHFDPTVVDTKYYDFDEAPEAWVDGAFRIAAVRS